MARDNDLFYSRRHGLTFQLLMTIVTMLLNSLALLGILELSDSVEFLRRYAMHVLPRGFFRIRHYGFLAPCNRDRLAAMQEQLGAPPLDRHGGRRTWAQLADARGIVLGLCPECGKAPVVTISYLPMARSPDAARNAPRP